MLKYLNELDSSTHYHAGMYGGKFLPMHKGHLYCVEQASKLCDEVYLILFYGGAWERLVRNLEERDIFSKEFRWNQVQRVAKQFDNVYPYIIDISSCIGEDECEDWDAETPLVLNTCPKRFDAVFGSEPVLYAPYFERAYPWSDYIIIDADREKVPISATAIRYEMNEKEAQKWMV